MSFFCGVADLILAAMRSRLGCGHDGVAIAVVDLTNGSEVRVELEAAEQMAVECVLSEPPLLNCAEMMAVGGAYTVA